MAWKRKKNKTQTGWESKIKNESIKNNESLSKNQVIQTKKSNNIFEKIFKWIIYAILFIAVPRHLKSSKTKGQEIVNHAYDKMHSHEFAFIPAGYALYLFLSFIPVSILMTAIIGPINEHYDIVLRYVILGSVIPGIQDVLPKMSDLWSNAGEIVTFIIFIFSIIWLSSNGYSKFVHSIDALYEHKTENKMWKYRLKGIVVSLVLTCGLTLLLLAFTAFMTFLIDESNFGVFPNEWTDLMTIKDLKLTTPFWLVYYFTIFLCLPIFTYIGFLLFFKYAPSFKLKLNYIHPGAMISSIPTSIFILIFGSLTSIIRYQKYGPIAAFMYVILLTSVMSYFIYIGVIVNASFYKVFINEPTVEKSFFFKKRLKSNFYKKYRTEDYNIKE
ncbi:Ribonuclease BN-like family [Metamycoplasma cloacale]|uniref:YihY/virulence factor BrkB family protein n=1 Tax=Metamycoplasma cloacale TaxID=92401 RepID=A0A2Z4LN31_9BACT|nr:YhjD/YihY/BrkB family envelope integrity protein [Metamycoplasma cloacale]AWX42647.1 YihY/virulence factor BrkB family protein [Metamycoplasma cloacale]VEU79565.1 Ribonuclease BN-like family [Metamycoplasma cloacale]